MNSYKATILLVIVAIGFFLTYPFNNTFAGGLLSSVFGAAMIGGLADWFGVSALFRKPLGIPFKTEIIPRNREKIFNALSDMVGEELLTKDNINEMINKNSISGFFIKYLSENKDNKRLKEVASKMVSDIVWKISPKETGKLIEGLIKENILKIKISNIIAAAIEVSINKGYDLKIIDFIVDELIKLTKTEQAAKLIVKLVEETMKSYEKGMKRRRFVNSIIFDMILQLSPYEISLQIQNKLIDSLGEFKNPTNQTRVEFMIWMDQKIKELKSDSALQEKIENWKAQQINNELDLHSKIADFIENIRDKNLENSSEVDNLNMKIEEKLNKLIDEFKVNIEWQKKLDYKAKGLLLEFVDNNHSKIGSMVKENLNKFSNDMIVNLIETKVGNDLQMIRINGSVVGGLVGMMTFLLTFWI
ncbi:hypothetical protein CLSAP_26360 [Clostridium saccharoperbutylacetonicum]|nr:DUF445 domain-containing protein [Clostridium saccharoperbutylacetonicum]AQR95320.1 hypothetical protein CLSAP_26360 [Clostridium saccharoperbutylacetonicum]NSB31175.1 uncharacterized membrane-anchored protein YjiN (DUF445 family) [Clostridium saccharoperbutylacetonicum]